MCKNVISFSEAKITLDTFAYKILWTNKPYDYVAIRKSKKFGYIFEIGYENYSPRTQRRLKMSFNISELNRGILNSNEIPIPLFRPNSCRSRKYFSQQKFSEKTIKVRFKAYDNEKINFSKPFNSKQTPKTNKTSKRKKFVIQPGIKIGSSVPDGSLGFIFKIDGYNNYIFGLSNSHVLNPDGKEIKSGIKTYISGSPNSKTIEVGKVFWDEYSDEKDAAICVFNKEVENKIELNSKCNDNFTGISYPKFNEKVGLCGTHYFKPNDPDNSKKIYSIDAYVRVENGNNKKIYCNQILVDSLSTNSDSGSILFNKDNKIIGLVIGTTSTKSGEINFTVANNINLLFNHLFKKKKTVFVNNKLLSDIESFKIKL